MMGKCQVRKKEKEESEMIKILYKKYEQLISSTCIYIYLYIRTS